MDETDIDPDPPEGAPEGLLTLRAGDLLGGYRVVRTIARGGMGTVCLARDVNLGRLVALKFLTPELGTEGWRRSHLLAEARATARLSHPNIVAVYAVGEERGVPYLVLEYVEGAPLSERMREERPSPAETVRIARAVATGLAAAHAVGVVHGDLKPANVIIGRDGRTRILDFGVSRLVDSRGWWSGEGGAEELRAEPDSSTDEDAASSSSAQTLDGKGSSGEGAPDGEPGTGRAVLGTPAYMAPEQWAGYPERASDVWAFGVVLHQLLTGRKPYTGRRHAIRRAVMVAGAVPRPPELLELPHELGQLLLACLEKAPERRPTAEEIVRSLEAIETAPAERRGEESCPFRGLLAFSEDDARLFFGREREVDEAAERLRHDRSLLVVGASGAGKSSFVRAGVLPRLHQAGPLRVVSFRPGPRPFLALAQAMVEPSVVAVEPEDDEGATVETEVVAAEGAGAGGRPASRAEALADRLRAAPGALPALLALHRRGEAERVLLLVDQLEELATLVADESERRLFVEALGEVARAVDEPVRLVMTLRDDFLGRLPWGRSAADLLGATMVLDRLDEARLRKTIERPLEAVRYRFDDPALADELVEAVLGETAGLAILQFALTELWDRRDEEARTLTRSAYLRMGAVAGVLARHADLTLDSLAPVGANIAREMLLRLVTPEGTRRVVPRGDLLRGLSDEAELVLAALVRARLVVVRRSASDEEAASVELAHESLVLAWSRLRAWLETGKEELASLAELEAAAALWDRRGRGDDELWAGEALREAGRTVERSGGAVSEVARAFVSRGLARARASSVRRRRLRGVAAAVLVAVAAAASLVAWAMARSEAAAQAARDVAERREAEARDARAEALFRAGVSARLRGDPLEARSLLRRALELRDTVEGRALWTELRHEPLLWSLSSPRILYDVAFSPDGSTAAVASQGGTVLLFDTRTAAARVLRGHEDQVVSVTFDGEGRRLASGDWSGVVRLADLAGEAPPLVLEGPPTLRDLALSRDGRRLMARSDAEVRLFALPEGREIGRVPLTGVSWVGLSPLDGRVVVARGGAVRALGDDLRETGVTLVRVEDLSRAAFSADGRALATLDRGGRAALYDPGSGTALLRVPGRLGRFDGMRLSPDGRRVLLWKALGRDARVTVVDGASGEALETLRGFDFIRTAQMDRSGGLVAVLDRRTMLLRRAPAAPGGAESSGRGHGAAVYGVVFDGRGRLLASSDDGALIAWDLATGEPVDRVAFGRNKPLLGGTVGADRLAIQSEHHPVELIDLDDWSPTARFPLPELPGEIAISRDGRVLAATSSAGRPTLQGGRLTVLSLTDGRTILDVSTPSYLWRAAPSPDGSTIATAGHDGAVLLWDVASGEHREVLRHRDAVRGLSWSPDGTLLASGGTDGAVGVYDLRTSEARMLEGVDGRVYQVAVLPDRSAVAAAAADSRVYLLPLGGGSPLRLEGHRDEVNRVAVDGSGRLLASGSDDGTVRLWDLATGSPIWRGTGLLGEPPVTYSHRGWSAEVGDVVERLGEPLRRAVEAGVTRTASRPGTVCVLTRGGRVEAYRTVDGAGPLRGAEAEGARDVVALEEGCAALLPDAVLLVTPEGERRVEVLASAIGPAPSGLAAAVGDGVVLLDAGGREVERLPTIGPVVAVSASSAGVMIGFRDGAIERLSGPGIGETRYVSPTTVDEVSRILVDPEAGLLAAGFVDGSAALWDLSSARLLLSDRTYGAVVDLAFSEGSLLVATDLGARARLDLSDLSRPYCELLSEVWADVPTAVVSGRIELAPPPPDHPCVRSRGGRGEAGPPSGR